MPCPDAVHFSVGSSERTALRDRGARPALGRGDFPLLLGRSVGIPLARISRAGHAPFDVGQH
ncbi:hypothetical protein EH165_09760 [Nakamurella antarctica]|uniref:Uncharacterized protein n=1 Tax=Nakamurella antarctica TaxID=1902245 RepID=A0A3G8ZM04_9ACTN|nr:hypothetical protein [Nakamurella antarctica]AZI58382.1 hypothetical protein EH165_09760 [Nakamurella antarctica]